MKIEFLLRFYTEVSFLGTGLSFLSNLTIKLLLSRLVRKPDEVSAYECGLYTTRGSREKDRISFYTLGLTFLIFDLELLLIFPFLFSIPLLRENLMKDKNTFNVKEVNSFTPFHFVLSNCYGILYCHMNVKILSYGDSYRH